MRAVKKILVSLVLMIPTSALFAGNCSWQVQPTAVNFGTYSVFSTSTLTTTTNFAFRCTPNLYARLMLSQGRSGVYVPSRIMANGANTVGYNVYLDAGGTQIWGDASGGSVSYDVYNSTPQNKDFTDSMYGIAPPGGDVAAGTYTDTIVAVLGYSNNSTGPFTTLPAVAITVQMIVAPECRVDVFNLDFGAYNPFAVGAVNQSSLLKVYCTKSSAPTSVVLNNGSFPLGAQRRMMSPGGSFLNYDAALGSTSGNSTSSLVPINGGFAVNGSIPAQQDVAVGAYTDTLVATVNY
ncbi:MAG TPA: spore coat protein U domain-containing protein [Thermoanaerobaculia bacterium]|nr:spore coat protein U domain-containing protein [Thermoanaerobaculia bacterium]